MVSSRDRLERSTALMSRRWISTATLIQNCKGVLLSAAIRCCQAVIKLSFATSLSRVCSADVQCPVLVLYTFQSSPLNDRCHEPAPVTIACKRIQRRFKVQLRREAAHHECSEWHTKIRAICPSKPTPTLSIIGTAGLCKSFGEQGLLHLGTTTAGTAGNCSSLCVALVLASDRVTPCGSPSLVPVYVKADMQ